MGFIAEVSESREGAIGHGLWGGFKAIAVTLWHIVKYAAIALWNTLPHHHIDSMYHIFYILGILAFIGLVSFALGLLRD